MRIWRLWCWMRWLGFFFLDYLVREESGLCIFVNVERRGRGRMVNCSNEKYNSECLYIVSVSNHWLDVNISCIFFND